VIWSVSDVVTLFIYVERRRKM